MNFHFWKTNFLQKAENYWLLGLFLSLLLPLLTLGSAILEKNSTPNKTNFYLTLIGLFCVLFPIIIQLLKLWSQENFAIGDKFNRWLFYENSLNIRPSTQRVLSLLPLSIRAIVEAKTADPGYYSSNSPCGHKKMIENLMESAYFTSKLASFSAFFFSIIVAVSVGVIFISLYLASNLQVLDSSMLLQFALAATAFFSTCEIFFIRGQYVELASSSDQIFSECASLLEKDPIDEKQAVFTVEEYHLIRIQYPPILSYIYLWKKDALNASYSKLQKKEE